MRLVSAVPAAAPLALAAAFALAPAAHAQGLELVSTDERGVTVRFELGDWHLDPPGRDGRSRLVARGLDVTADPGRGQVAFARTFIAVPPGARATARVVDGSALETRDGVRLTLGMRAGFRNAGEGLGPQPVLEPVPPVVDGAWPRTVVEVGAPLVVRRQRMVPLYVRPFRYDEASGRLSWQRSITVRVDFVGALAQGPPAPEDRHWEGVLQGAVLNYRQGRSLRLAPPAPAGGGGLFPEARPGRVSRAGAAAVAPGFDEDYPEVRCRVDTTGLWELRYDDLAAKGYPAGVPIDEVSLHRHQFVEGATPPYETFEIPIAVDDANGNGVFDSGDRIVAWVRDWVERSGMTSVWERAWGDAEVVYATRKAGGGLRMGTRPGWRGTPGLTPLASYPWSRKWERNYHYNTFVPDTTTTDPFSWTSLSQYYVRPESLRFETNDLDPSHSVTFTIRLNGLKNNQHFDWVQVKNGSGTYTTVVDSTVSWSGKGAVNRTATLPGTAFSEGLTNRVRIWGRTSAVLADPPNLFEVVNDGVDWYEAGYWRAYRAIRGLLDCTTGNASGEVQLLARGFATDSIRVWDVTDPEAPVRLTLDPSHVTPDGAGYAIEFQDSVAFGTPHRYAVFDQPKPVPAANLSSVTRRHLTERSGGDYLLVVPEAFMAAAQPLADFRASQGLDVVMAPLESVQDEFNGGRKASFAIKRFVKYAYDHWNARFLLLAGDGSEDPRDFTGEAGVDWVPIQRIRAPVAVTEGLESAPSDTWYVWCLDCVDPQLAVRLPDMYVGRLPANSPADLTAMVNKIKGYEQTIGDPDQTWRRRMTLSADDTYSQGLGFGTVTPQYCEQDGEIVFEQLSQTVRNVILVDAGLSQAEPEVFSLAPYLANLPCTTCPAESCRDVNQAQSTVRVTYNPDLFQRLNAGRLWWSFQGHANSVVLADEYIYQSFPGDDDITKFTNTGRPFLFTAHSCHANQFDRADERRPGNPGPCLGEDMVTLPGKGAVASWASVSYEILPRPGGTTHIEVELARTLFQDPPSDPYLGRSGARVVLGEAIADALIRYYPTGSQWAGERDIAMTYTLLGDPATRLSIGPPETSVLANGLPVQDGQTVRLHTPGAGLRLDANLASNVALSAISVQHSDSSATLTVPDTAYTLTPAFPDTLPGSSGGRRYQLVLDTTLTAENQSWVFHTTDRYGVQGQFEVKFELQSVLRAEGLPINDGDAVAPTANLSLLVLSPAPLDPPNDLTLTVNGAAQPFAATPAPGDTSQREWVLAWSHAAYPIDQYEVALSIRNGPTLRHRFRVVVGGNELRLENAFAFPNPFDDHVGTYFTFNLVSGSPADLLIRVYTVSGRLVYVRHEKGLLPGHHQLHWNGLDAEGSKLANGIYFYRMLASNGASRTMYQGRLVKLRKPYRTVEPSAGAP